MQCSTEALLSLRLPSFECASAMIRIAPQRLQICSTGDIGCKSMPRPQRSQQSQMGQGLHLDGDSTDGLDVKFPEIRNVPDGHILHVPGAIQVQVQHGALLVHLRGHRQTGRSRP